MAASILLSAYEKCQQFLHRPVNIAGKYDANSVQLIEHHRSLATPCLWSLNHLKWSVFRLFDVLIFPPQFIPNQLTKPISVNNFYKNILGFVVFLWLIRKRYCLFHIACFVDSNRNEFYDFVSILSNQYSNELPFNTCINNSRRHQMYASLFILWTEQSF